MLCDICKKNPATISQIKISQNSIEKLNLCPECAKKMQMEDKIIDLKSSIITELADDFKTKEEDVSCSKCKLSYYDFKKIGLLGCPQCYTSFKKQLKIFIKKIQGNLYHVGKKRYNIEMKNYGIDEEIKTLKRQIDNAIKQEDYERAAVIRDRIKELEEKKKDKDGV